MAGNGHSNRTQNRSPLTNAQELNSSTSDVQNAQPVTEMENRPRNEVEAGNGENDESKDAEVAERTETPKPSKLKALWGKLGLDFGTVVMMFK
jgi:hypothetical protein